MTHIGFFHRASVEQRVDRGGDVDGLLPQFALQPREITENGLRSAKFQFVRNGSAVHQNGDVSQIEGGRLGLNAQQQERHGASVAFQRRLAHQPVSSQHPNDVTHADYSRGEFPLGISFSFSSHFNTKGFW